MKEIKVEWCENFIRATFKCHAIPGGGIEVGCFWNMAEKAGLWIRDTYDTPMTKALENLTNVEIIQDAEENYLYTVFELK